jgi:hypothetical protein
MRHVKPLIKYAFGYIVTETPYSSEWVQAVKHCIPSTDREYDGETKMWTFPGRYYECIKHLVETFFGNSYIDSAADKVSERQNTAWRDKFDSFAYQPPPRADQSTASATSRTAYATLFVTEDAPPEIIRAAFRTLAKMHHPDQGGDADKMTEVNAAYQKLKKLRAV